MVPSPTPPAWEGQPPPPLIIQVNAGINALVVVRQCFGWSALFFFFFLGFAHDWVFCWGCVVFKGKRCSVAAANKTETQESWEDLEKYTVTETSARQCGSDSGWWPHCHACMHACMAMTWIGCHGPWVAMHVGVVCDENCAPYIPEPGFGLIHLLNLGFSISLVWWPCDFFTTKKISPEFFFSWIWFWGPKSDFLAESEVRITV